MPAASQRAIVGAFPSRIGALEHGLGETVDLEVEDPRHVRLDAGRATYGRAVHDTQRVRIVVVRAEEHLQAVSTAEMTSAAMKAAKSPPRRLRLP